MAQQIGKVKVTGNVIAGEKNGKEWTGVGFRFEMDGKIYSGMLFPERTQLEVEETRMEEIEPD